MSKTCEIVVYTSNGAMSFDVVATTDDFQERLANALEEGTVMLDTVEGSKLILNAINVVAIEVNTVAEASGKPETIPPIRKI